MEKLEKLGLLSQQMDVEQDDDRSNLSCLPPVSQERIYISHAIMPNGKKLRLLKTALTSACENNCYYCAFRAGRDFHRATFQPEELAHTFISIYHAGLVQGLFISSGVINGGLCTQDRLIDVADILRNKLDFRGYIHLKIMPGAEYDQMLRSMQLADRVSINLEAPNEFRLASIAPRKSYFEELMTAIVWMDQIRKSQDPYYGWNHHWPSSSTQFVVGAAGENDTEILTTTETLYQKLHLKRAYFSKFRPISDTPFAEKSGESPARELRLYQASFLLRDYGYQLLDIPFDNGGNIPLHTDPKYSWAESHLIDSPIEINQAGKQELLRIPGIGPKSAQMILEKRCNHKIKSLDELGKIGVNTRKMSPFILLDGKKPAHQMSFYFF